MEDDRLALLLRFRHVSASRLNRQELFRGYPQYLPLLPLLDKRSTSFQIRRSFSSELSM